MKEALIDENDRINHDTFRVNFRESISLILFYLALVSGLSLRLEEPQLDIIYIGLFSKDQTFLRFVEDERDAAADPELDIMRVFRLFALRAFEGTLLTLL